MMKRLEGLSRMLLVFALVLGGGAGCTKQMRKARNLSRGEKDFAAEQYDRAEIDYLKVLRFPPPDPQAVARLGIIYYNQGRWANAIGFLNEAIKLQPTNTEARIKLGMGQLMFQQARRGREQALTVLAKEPENPEALLLLAGASNLAQELAQAEQVFDKVSPQARAKPGYHLARGALYLHQKDVVKAEGEYRRELALDPKSSQACLALGNLFVLRQDVKQAEPLLKSAAELAPLHSGARLAYAQLRLASGARKEAAQSIQELVKKAPDFLPAWLFLARVAAADGKREESATCLQRVLSRDAVNLEGLSMNGSLLLAKGDGTNAAGMFERIIRAYAPGPPQIHYNLALAHVMNRDFTKAVISLNRALELQTNYVDAIVLLANLNVRQGNPGAAISSLTRLVQQQPQLAQVHQALAAAYLSQKSYEEAAGVYRGMMQVFTNNAEVPFNLGSTLLMQNKINEARQAFEKSLAVSPDFLPSIEQLVELDLKQNRAAEAIERVKALIEKYPKAAPLQALLARIHMSQASAIVEQEKQKNRAGPELRLGDVPAARPEVDQAEAALLKAIELSPDYRSAYQMLSSLYVNSNRQQLALDRLKGLLARTNDAVCLLEMGVIQEQMKAYPAARDTYEKLLKFQPNAAEALNNLGFLYAEQLGELDKGYQLAEKARQLQPNNVYVADTLGWILYRRGEYARALSLIEESAQKLPLAPEIQYHLGMTHYMLGEEEPAGLALQRALKAGKEFSGSKEARMATEILAIDTSLATPASRSLLEQRLREVPGDPIALQRLAAIQQRDGQSAQALENYQRALKCNPNNARVLLMLAQLYCKMGNQTQQALQLAKQAHAVAPDDAQISSLLGRLAYQTRDYQWAASLLAESAGKLPSNPEVLYDLGWAQYSLGHVSEAKAAMQGALASGEKFVEADEAKRFLVLTGAAENPAQTEEHAAEAEKLVGADPDYVPGLMVCAAAGERRGDFKQAAELYDRVLARYPLFGPAVRNLALVSFAHLADDAKAYPLLAKARDALPGDVQVARALGIVSYRRSEYARCEQLLASNSQDSRGDGEALCYLGLAQYKLKENTRSKTTLQQALALDLPPKLADNARRVLAELK